MTIDQRLIDIFLDVAGIEGLSCDERRVADHIARFLGRVGMRVREDDAHRRSGGITGNVLAQSGRGGDVLMLPTSTPRGRAARRRRSSTPTGSRPTEPGSWAWTTVPGSRSCSGPPSAC